MFQTDIVEIIKTRFLFSNFYFYKNQGTGGETWGKETIGETQTQMGG